MSRVLTIVSLIFLMIVASCSPEALALEVTKNLTGSSPEIVMEYTEILGQNSRYVSTNLSRDISYPKIDVKGFSFLSEDPAIDKEGVLYYVFRDDTLNLAQLTPSGKSEIITLGNPNDYKAIWLEDRLFLELLQQSGKEYFTFDPRNGLQQLQLQFPALEGYEYVPYYYQPVHGEVGGLIRLLSRPYRDNGSEDAFYQLIDLEQGDYSEFRLPLPRSNVEAIPGQIPEGEKALLVIYGINHTEKQALICYYEGQTVGERSYLGVWDSKSGEMLWKKESRCMNAQFQFYKDNIYENCVSDYCLGLGIFSWASPSAAMPYNRILGSKDGVYIRFIPFENGWLIGTERRIITIDKQGNLLESLELTPGGYHWSYRLAQPIR